VEFAFPILACYIGELRIVANCNKAFVDCFLRGLSFALVDSSLGQYGLLAVKALVSIRDCHAIFEYGKESLVFLRESPWEYPFGIRTRKSSEENIGQYGQKLRQRLNKQS